MMIFFVVVTGGYAILQPICMRAQNFDSILFGEHHKKLALQIYLETFISLPNQYSFSVECVEIQCEIDVNSMIKTIRMQIFPSMSQR